MPRLQRLPWPPGCYGCRRWNAARPASALATIFCATCAADGVPRLSPLVADAVLAIRQN
ncbi:MAG: hypothetical protein ACLRZH_03595 [Ruthenibacterium lactatiformans]